MRFLTTMTIFIVAAISILLYNNKQEEVVDSNNDIASVSEKIIDDRIRRKSKDVQHEDVVSNNVFENIFK